MKVLIVDDEEGIRNLVCAFVSGNGNTVLTASDGLEGLAVAREFKPDVIVSDTQMPKMSGPDFLDAYRAENSQVKVILMSGDGLQDICKTYPSAANYVFLKKAFNYGEFRQVFDELSQTS